MTAFVITVKRANAPLPKAAPVNQNVTEPETGTVAAAETADTAAVHEKEYENGTDAFASVPFFL